MQCAIGPGAIHRNTADTARCLFCRQPVRSRVSQRLAIALTAALFTGVQLLLVIAIGLEWLAFYVYVSSALAIIAAIAAFGVSQARRGRRLS
jgi:hypothetical protein